jgi:hypothetical protein
VRHFAAAPDVHWNQPLTCATRSSREGCFRASKIGFVACLRSDAKRQRRQSDAAYIAQLRAELPAESFAWIQALLKAYQRDKKAHALIDGVVGALREKRHHRLLAGFCAFLSPADRPWLARCIRCERPPALHAAHAARMTCSVSQSVLLELEGCPLKSTACTSVPGLSILPGCRERLVYDAKDGRQK